MCDPGRGCLFRLYSWVEGLSQLGLIEPVVLTGLYLPALALRPSPQVPVPGGGDATVPAHH